MDQKLLNCMAKGSKNIFQAFAVAKKLNIRPEVTSHTIEKGKLFIQDNILEYRIVVRAAIEVNNKS